MGARVRYIAGRRKWQATAIHRYRRVSKDFPTRQAALEWASAAFTAIASGKPVEDAGRLPLLLSQWLQRFLQHHSTNERDARSLRPVVALIGRQRLDRLAEWHVRRYVSDRRASGIGNKTINHEVTSLRHAVYAAVTVGELPARPAIEWHAVMLPTQHRDRVLTDSEAAAIRAELPPWTRDAFDLALLTGLRWGDLINLTRESIDLDRAALVIQQRKNARPLTIPLTPQAMEIVRRNIANLDSCGYLLTNRRGTRLLKLRQQWLDACRRAKVSGATWHDLRHTYATRLVHAGAPRDVLAALLGDTPKVAALYATVSLDHKRQILEKACRAGVAFCLPL